MSSELNNLNLNLIEFCIDEKSAGLRIDKALAFHPEIRSRNRAQYLIENKCVHLNGECPKSSTVVHLGDKITIQIQNVESESLQPLDIKLDIVYEDSDLIVINKFSGMVIHPAAGHHQDTLVNALIGHTSDLSMKFGEDRPGIVHRLDKETSGLLVVAKNDLSHENLAQQFKERTIHRIYFAVTTGTPQKMSDKIISFLARHPVDRKRYASVKKNKMIYDSNSAQNEPSNKAAESIGKKAITNYQVLKSSGGLTYFKLKLETGRTHQIRIHLSELGHPILGDKLYGATSKYHQILSKETLHEVKNLNRFLLHAAELGFHHPKSNDWMEFKIDWPEDIKSLLIKWNLI